MLDLSWTIQPFVSLPLANRRVLVLVNHATAQPRLLNQLTSTTATPPAAIVLLWVVTPNSVVSWGALLAESGDRTHLLLAALSERIEEARRRMVPLQRACAVANISCETHVVHGAITESVIRVTRDEKIDQVLLPTVGGAVYGQPSQDLAMTLAKRLTVPVGTVEFE
jgi:hypothetical protein